MSRFQQEIKQSRPFSSLREEATLSLARTSALLTHVFEQALKPYGITSTQYNMLRILRGAGPDGLCRYEIGERLIAPVPDVSRLLDRLQANALVRRERSRADRRLVRATITEKGLALLAQLDQPSREVIDAHMPEMSDADLRRLLELLEMVRAGFAAKTQAKMQPPDRV